jgi:hypothetical protein
MISSLWIIGGIQVHLGWGHNFQVQTLVPPPEKKKKRSTTDYNFKKKKREG